MSIEDFRLSDVTSFDADLCLIGSGPAAYAIVSQLRGTALRIVVLESGGEEPEAEATALNDIESVGAPYINGRERTVGGTSQVWSGRCVDLSDIDYERRSWVPHSGWPISRETIAPYLNTAAQCLFANPFDPHGEEWEPGAIAPLPDFDASLVRKATWQVATPVRFGPYLRDRGGNVRVLTHATVTHIDTDPIDGRATSVEIAASTEHRATVRARAIVLCAGGNENARILLYSNRVVPNGVGNRHDLVGRYFMDHPRDRSMIAKFEMKDARAFRTLFGPFNFDNAYGLCDFFRGLELSPELQRREELLNCAAWPTLDVAPDDPINALRRFYYGTRDQAVRDVAMMATNPYTLVRGLYEGIATQLRMGQKFERVGFVIGSEQEPDPASRITLGAKRDRLGLPVGVLDWRVHEREMRSQARLAESIAAEFTRLSLPNVILADWVKTHDWDAAIAAQADGCHPIGTTRMSASANDGVVDTDCQVHGVAGLYVAGSSVFPTAGHANPTLMLVALAVRLAHHLRKQLSNPAEIAPSFKAEPIEPRKTVAVTGATGFIGGRLVERSLEEGASITCFTRGTVTDARLQRSRATLRTLDLTDRAELTQALSGVDVLYHCAYDWNDAAWNLAAIDALIAACHENRTHLVFLSSFVVYDAPTIGEVTEETAAGTGGEGYACVKSEMEGRLMHAARAGSTVTILQPTIVYGPHSRPWTIEPAEALRRGIFVLPDRGQGVCNAVYVDDVVAAMMLAAQRPELSGERFLISGPPITWAEFYGGMARAIGADGPQFRPAFAIARETGRVRRLLRLVADPNRVASRIASTRPGRILARGAANAVPASVRRTVAAGAARIAPNKRPFEFPDLGRLTFFRYRARVESKKARDLLGYVPAYDFARGMIATAQFLERYRSS